MIWLYSAGAIVYFQRGHTIEYLLLHYQSGHWEFPKGGIEEGETKQEAASREIKEETGLEAELKTGFQESFSYMYTDPETHELVKKIVYFFVAESDNKDVLLSFEHMDYAWLPLEKALEQLTYQNARNLLMQADFFIHKKESKKCC